MKEKFDIKIAQKLIRYHQKWVISFLPENKKIRIADIGCGVGYLLYSLRKNGYKNVVGVDIDQGTLDEAKKISPNLAKEDGLEYLEAKNNQFDLIIGFDFIEHLDKDRALKFIEIANKALKKDGWLILKTPNPENPGALSMIFGDITHKTFFTPKSLASIIHSLKFRNIEIQETTIIPRKIISGIRFIFWHLLRLWLMLKNLIETGETTKILTRTFIIKGQK